MKKLLAVVLVCNVFVLQGMQDQDTSVDGAVKERILQEQEEQGAFSRARVEHELSQARSEKLADITGSLSDEEYKQVELAYRVFIGENRVRLASKEDDSGCSGITILPDCTIKKLVLWGDDVQNILSACNSYRALMHCVWMRERELTRQQLLEDIADIMAMHDQLSVLTKKLDGTNEIQMHLIDIIGHESSQKRATVMTRGEELIASHKARKDARERAQLMSEVYHVVLGACVLVGGYFSYKNYSLIRERMQKWYRDLTHKKKRVEKSQKVVAAEVRT